MASDLHETSGIREDDTAEPPQLRRFRRLVSLMMVVMMVGILLVAAAMVWRLTQSDLTPSAPPADTELAVDPQFRVLSVSRVGPRLYLLLEDRETGEKQVEERAAADRSLLTRYRLVPSQN